MVCDVAAGCVVKLGCGWMFCGVSVRVVVSVCVAVSVCVVVSVGGGPIHTASMPVPIQRPYLGVVVVVGSSVVVVGSVGPSVVAGVCCWCWFICC